MHLKLAKYDQESQNGLKLVTWNPIHLNLKIYSKSFLTCDLFVCQRKWKSTTRRHEIACVSKPIMQIKNCFNDCIRDMENDGKVTEILKIENDTNW